MQFALFAIFISFFVTGFQFFAISGYGVTLLDFALLALYFTFFKEVLWNGKELRFSITPPLVFLLIMFAVVFISGITPLIEGRGDWIMQYFKTSIHFYFLAGMALVTAVYPVKMQTWKNVIKFWVVLALILNIFAIYQIIARATDLPLAWIEFNNVSFARGAAEGPADEIKQLSLHYGNFYRATSIFSEPSALGAFNSYILAFLLIPYVFNLKHYIKSKTLIVATMIFTAMGTFFTFSLTAILGAFSILGGFLLMRRIQHLARFVIIIVSFFVIIILADSLFAENMGVSVVELFTKRIEGILNIAQGDDKMVVGESFNVRRASAEKALEVWKEYPILGIGAGLSYKNKINDLEFSDFTVFGILAEYGIIGLIAFLAFFFSLMMIAYRLARSKYDKNLYDEDEKYMMHIPFFIMIVLFIINFISGNPFVVINDWAPLAIVMSVLNFDYMNKNRNVVRFKLVKYPLKELFKKSLHAENTKNSAV